MLSPSAAPRPQLRLPQSAATGGRRLLALLEGTGQHSPAAPPAAPERARDCPRPGEAAAPPRQSGAGQGRAGCASQGRAESIGRHRRRQSAGRPGSEAQRNFGDLQCPARVSDSNSSLTGRRMLWVRLHVLKSVMLIFLIFTNAISEVLLR